MIDGIDVPPIYKLPDELLADVFVQATLSGSRHDVATHNYVFSLASTSRLFRRICLATARLWAVVSLHQRRETRALCLTRSKETGLCVHLPFDEGFEGYGSFLADVVPYANRWKEFFFQIDDTTSKRVYILTSLSVICHKLFLPRLETLHIVMPVSDPWNHLTLAMNDNPKSEILHFYRTWVTPQLKTLTSENLVPLNTGSKKLRKCAITVRGKNAQGNLRVPALLDLAPSWHLLKSLVIHFGEEPFWEPLSPILLPCAEDVEIGLTLGGNIDTPKPNYIMDALHMPTVRRLAIAFIEGACLNLDKCVASLFPEHESYECLESLRLLNKTCISGLNLGDTGLDCFNLIISRLPRIRHLTLELATFMPPKVLRTRMPPLTSLRIYDSVWVDIAFIEMVMASLHADANGAWREFRTLEVSAEARICMEELKESFPEATVTRTRYVKDTDEDDVWTVRMKQKDYECSL